jgi:hypothetical protein
MILALNIGCSNSKVALFRTGSRVFKDGEIAGTTERPTFVGLDMAKSMPMI